MIKLNQYLPYIGIKKAVKAIYEGDIFLRIDEIKFSFLADDADDIMRLIPTYYTVVGQYGRLKEDLDFYRDFSIDLNIEWDEDTIEAVFYEYLMNIEQEQSD